MGVDWSCCSVGAEELEGVVVVLLVDGGLVAVDDIGVRRREQEC